MHLRLRRHATTVTLVRVSHTRWQYIKRCTTDRMMLRCSHVVPVSGHDSLRRFIVAELWCRAVLHVDRSSWTRDSSVRPASPRSELPRVRGLQAVMCAGKMNLRIVRFTCGHCCSKIQTNSVPRVWVSFVVGEARSAVQSERSSHEGISKPSAGMSIASTCRNGRSGRVQPEDQLQRWRCAICTHRRRPLPRSWP